MANRKKQYRYLLIKQGNLNSIIITYECIVIKDALKFITHWLAFYILWLFHVMLVFCVMHCLPISPCFVSVWFIVEHAKCIPNRIKTKKCNQCPRQLHESIWSGVSSHALFPNHSLPFFKMFFLLLLLLLMFWSAAWPWELPSLQSELFTHHLFWGRAVLW